MNKQKALSILAVIIMIAVTILAAPLAVNTIAEFKAAITEHPENGPAAVGFIGFMILASIAYESFTARRKVAREKPEAVNDESG